MTYAWYWPNARSRVTHAYETGPGAGDASLCGVLMESASKPSMHEADPKCARCSRREGDGRSAVEGFTAIDQGGDTRYWVTAEHPVDREGDDR